MQDELTYSQMQVEDRGQVLGFLRLAYPDTKRKILLSRQRSHTIKKRSNEI